MLCWLCRTTPLRSFSACDGREGKLVRCFKLRRHRGGAGGHRKAAKPLGGGGGKVNLGMHEVSYSIPGFSTLKKKEKKVLRWKGTGKPVRG